MRQITLKCEEMPLHMLKIVLKDAQNVLQVRKMSLKCPLNMRKFFLNQIRKNLHKKCEKINEVQERFDGKEKMKRNELNRKK